MMLRYTACRDNTKGPDFANPGDTGADIFANFNNLDTSAFLRENPDLDPDLLDLGPNHEIEGITLEAGCSVMVPTGLKLIIPQERVEIPGFPCGFQWGVQVRPKSGIAYKHSVTVTNSPGTVDSGYLGEIKVLLSNLNGDFSTSEMNIKQGQKIAQIVLELIPAPGDWIEVDPNYLDTVDSTRGDGGFGSTGV